MGFNNNTKQYNYSTDDLIGFAKIGSYGPKSIVLLQALIKLKNYEMNVPKLENQLDNLREAIRAPGKIQEVVIETTNKKGK